MSNPNPVPSHGDGKNLMPDSISGKQLAIMAALGVLCFLLLCLTTSTHIKFLALIATLLAGGTLALRVPDIRERFTLPLVAVAAWVIMQGISTLYAVSGKFAIYEFTKVLFSFGVFVLVVSYETEDRQQVGRRTATIAETITALAGLFSIDMLSTHLLSTPLLTVLGLFTDSYTTLSGVEVGTRMTSLFDNPNIFAGCAGIGVLLSLGLATTAQSRNARRYHVICLAVNALSFVLAFSMGASGMIALAFVVYLIFEQKSRRADLIVLMVETLVLSVAAMFPIYVTSFDAWDGVQPIPLVCTIVVAALLCVADQFSQKTLVPKLQQHTKAVIGLIVAIIVLVGVYAALALNITGSINLGAGETLRRSIYPAAGTYTLQVESDKEVSVVIESQNREDTMMHTSSVLYSGSAQGASFVVPEDSEVVYFNFTAGEATQLVSATYQGDGGQGEVKLGYKLLPGFVANRLQGLFANQNAIQRLVFFEDGMKLFQRSPVYGLGMGAFENGVTSVQSFFYETKYAHNHYIQVLVETGVIGFVLFLGTLLSMAAVLLLNRRKKELAHPMVPALLAALVFMAAHAGVEVVFSSNFYLPLVFFVFALICLCCGEELSLFREKELVKTCVQRGAAVLMGVYVLLLGGNMCAQYMFQKAATYDAIEDCIMVDKFEWADYMLSYVYSASAEENPTYEMEQNLPKYMAKLEQQNSNTIPLYLAQAYFNLGQTEDAIRMLEKYVNYVPSDHATWNAAFNTLMTNVREEQAYVDGVRRIYDMMKQWESENMGTITLDQTVSAFLSYMLPDTVQTPVQ